MYLQPDIAPYKERYANLDHTPLRVVAKTLPGSQVAMYEPIHLDSLLARAMVGEATQGKLLADQPDAYDLPIPLAVLWRDAAGFPLWASTCIFPVGEGVRDTSYRHKRAQSGEFTLHGKGAPMPLKTVAGRWMERRTPVPTVLATEWEAFCIGDGTEVLRLLSLISFLGRNRGTGFGAIHEWMVETVDDFCLSRDGRLARPIPVAAAGALDISPVGAVGLCGWTPPQWLPRLQAAGWRCGTEVRA